MDGERGREPQIVQNKNLMDIQEGERREANRSLVSVGEPGSSRDAPSSGLSDRDRERDRFVGLTSTDAIITHQINQSVSDRLASMGRDGHKPNFFTTRDIHVIYISENKVSTKSRSANVIIDDAPANKIRRIDHVLRIDLQNVSSVASAALRKQIKYETLELTGDFPEDSDDSDLYHRFWQTMGNTITELIIHNDFKINCGYERKRFRAIVNHFVVLRQLTTPRSLLQNISPEFYTRNKELEVIDIYDDHPKPCMLENINRGRGWEILPEFENLLNYCTSLKRISFPTRLPYNTALCNAAIAYLTNKYSHVNAALFESSTLFSKSKCFIKKVEMEILKRNEVVGEVTKQIIVRVIDIDIELGDRDCVFEHNICICKTVTTITVSSIGKNRCRKCMEFVIKCFPNARYIESLWPYPEFHSSTIALMSRHLSYLTDLKLSYYESLALWPVFEQLKCLKINLYADQSSAELIHLCQCCPNLKNFEFLFNTVRNFREITGETVVDIVTQNLVEIKKLRIDVGLKISSRSLDAICANLKQLTEIEFGFNDDSQDLLKLFKELPQLQSIGYRNNARHETLTLTQHYQSLLESHSLTVATDMNSRDALDILPGKVWVKILQHTNIYDQVTCRSVCTKWWHILSEHPHFDRTLKIGDCLLAYHTNPVKVFSNTQFNYNFLSLQGPVIICNNELNDFWGHLGRTINKIRFGDEITLEALLQLLNSGMTIENLPKLNCIIFNRLKTFFELISKNYAAISSTLKAITKFQVSPIGSLYNDKSTEFRDMSLSLDMPNLEFLELPRPELHVVKFIKSIDGHCPRLHTLHMASNLIPQIANTSILSQLKHLKILRQFPTDSIIFILNCKSLKTLIIEDWGGSYDYEHRDTAIGLFKEIENLTGLSFRDGISETTKTKYVRDCESSAKKIVESKYSDDGHIVRNEIVLET